jgi:hypothetical protein
MDPREIQHLGTTLNTMELAQLLERTRTAAEAKGYLRALEDLAIRAELSGPLTAEALRALKEKVKP